MRHLFQFALPPDEVVESMNVYLTRLHRRPLLKGTTDADTDAARASGFDVDLFLHPAGIQEWAVCLRNGDDPMKLPGWRPSRASADL